MHGQPRTYRKKPLAVFERGTRIYAPSRGESRYRVVSSDGVGNRLFYKLASEAAARAKAREIEAHLARRAPLRPPTGHGTVAALAEGYLEHLGGRSVRYRERQQTIIRRWVLPHLGPVEVFAWTPAHSERLVNAARASLSPATVQSVGSCLRSLVTFAHKSGWLPREADPMWHVAYSARAEHQGQAVGFIPRDTLPSDDQCLQLFDALAALGQPTWALAMRLAHRSGARWGELIALRPSDIDFEPTRIVRIHRAVEQSARGRAFKAPKNAQKRTAVFPASLASDLAGHVEAVRNKQGDEALLFPGADGQPAERRQFLRLWHRAALVAGWPMRTSGQAIWHPQDLRHVAACWLLFNVGLDPAVAAPMLGHANPAFTLSRYVGVRTGADAATNALMEQW